MDLVACCGGDGTFNETVTGTLRSGKKIELGYIPCGSTNDFASSLGLSLDIMTAAEKAVSGTKHSIDAGAFGDRFFTYVASFGAFTKASYSTPQNVKNLVGHLAYIFQGGLELTSLKPERTVLEAGGKIYEGDYIFGAVSNSTSLGGVLSIAPQRVDMNDGLFEVMLIKYPNNAAELSRIVQALSEDNLEGSDMIEFFSANEIKILKNPAGNWSLDGEFAEGADGAEIKNIKSAITLVC